MISMIGSVFIRSGWEFVCILRPVMNFFLLSWDFVRPFYRAREVLGRVVFGIFEYFWNFWNFCSFCLDKPGLVVLLELYTFF